MEVLTSTEKQLKKFAGLLGILQGLAYTIMSLACIVLYLQNRKKFHPASYMDLVSDVMYSMFLDRSNDGFKEQSLTPRVFTGFMWVYFLTSLAWTLSSIKILNKNKGGIRLALRAWVYVTCIVSLLDLVTVIIIGSDYQKCLELSKNPELDLEIEATCANGILPVLVIAAKGFVLWVVNVIFARVIFKMAKSLNQPNLRQLGTKIVSLQPSANRAVQGPLDAYAQYPPPQGFIQSEGQWVNNYQGENQVQNYPYQQRHY